MSQDAEDFACWDPERGSSTRARVLQVALFLALLAWICAQLLFDVPRPPTTALWLLELTWLIQAGLGATQSLSRATLRVDRSGITRAGSSHSASHSWNEVETVVLDPRRAIVVLGGADGIELERMRIHRYDDVLRHDLEQALVAHGGARFDRGVVDPPSASGDQSPLPTEYTLTDEVGWGRPPILLLLAEADPIDGEMHTVAAVLTWTITGNSAVAQQLLAEGARRGTHTALNDLYTEAIALG